MNPAPGDMRAERLPLIARSTKKTCTNEIEMADWK